MTEQEQQLIELYLRDLRKKRIILFVIFLVIISFLLGTYYLKYYQKNITVDNIVENKDVSAGENNQITNEITEININTISEQKSNENTKENIVEQPQEKVEETKNIEQTQTTTTKTSEKKEETLKPQKPSNKDFLFTDGYTMENVSQIAENYLRSSGYAGKCIPLTDDEGIYIGMRVVFD